MRDFVELAVGATASGCVYALVALAYLLVTRPTGIINFAVGEWAMVAAFGGFVALSHAGLPYAAGMLLVEQKLDIALPFASCAYVIIKGRIALAESRANLARRADLADLYFDLATQPLELSDRRG